MRKGFYQLAIVYNEFLELLRQYKVPEILTTPLRLQLKEVFDEQNENKAKEKKQFDEKLKIIKEDIDKVRLKFGTGKIDSVVYEASVKQLSKQEADIFKHIEETKLLLSNHKDFIDFSIGLSQNLDQAWISADTRIKQILQRVIFPEGVMYDNKDHTYRTIKVHRLFNVFHSISILHKTIKEEKTCYSSSYSALVVPTGIEPVSKV